MSSSFVCITGGYISHEEFGGDYTDMVVRDKSKTVILINRTYIGLNRNQITKDADNCLFVNCNFIDCETDGLKMILIEK